jgi:hypothetical protein
MLRAVRVQTTFNRGYTGGLKGKGRFASVGQSHQQRARRCVLLASGGHGLTYDPGCIAEVACTPAHGGRVTRRRQKR